MVNGYSSYSRTQSTSETVRETEAQALLRCAKKLEIAQLDDAGYFDYCDAVRQNQKLWTLFQASLLEDDCKLPPQLVETLKGLSIYVDRRSLRAIGEFDKALLQVLIDINKQIAMGLLQRAEGEIDAAPQIQPKSQQTPLAPAGGSISLLG